MWGTYHSANSSGLLRVLLTMRAPWDGGLDQVVLTIFSIWDRVRERFSLSLATTVRFPTLSSSNSSKETRNYIKIHDESKRCLCSCSVSVTTAEISKCASQLLTVQAKVFGEGLSNEELKSLRDKEANGPGVFIQTARGEALIGWVKERKQLPPLETRRQRNRKHEI